VVACVATLLVVAAPAGAATIAGSVTDASTHAGIADVTICAYKALPSQSEAESLPESKFCTTPELEPETAGEYNLGGVPAGPYKVRFQPDIGSKYAPQFYDHVQTWDEAQVLAVPTGTPIDATLEEATPPEKPVTEGGAADGAQSSPAGLDGLSALPIMDKVAPRPLPLHCRRGFRKKKVKGKPHCVKLHPAKRRRHAK
jgi:hypothetical protein